MTLTPDCASGVGVPVAVGFVGQANDGVGLVRRDEVPRQCSGVLIVVAARAGGAPVGGVSGEAEVVGKSLRKSLGMPLLGAGADRCQVRLLWLGNLAGN